MSKDATAKKFCTPTFEIRRRGSWQCLHRYFWSWLLTFSFFHMFHCNVLSDHGLVIRNIFFYLIICFVLSCDDNHYKSAYKNTLRTSVGYLRWIKEPRISRNFVPTELSFTVWIFDNNRWGSQSSLERNAGYAIPVFVQVHTYFMTCC